MYCITFYYKLFDSINSHAPLTAGALDFNICLSATADDKAISVQRQTPAQARAAVGWHQPEAARNNCGWHAADCSRPRRSYLKGA